MRGCKDASGPAIRDLLTLRVCQEVAALRQQPGWSAPSVPAAWRACEEPLATGRVVAPDPRQGLLSLARMLSAGAVAPPWQLGLTPRDCTGSFDARMGYADAFRLWLMDAFDDLDHARRDLAGTAVPAAWEQWIAEQLVENP